MKMEMFSIFDTKVGEYHNPFYARNSEEAKRMVKSAANDQGSNLNQYPMDYILFQIGEFDGSNAFITQVEAPVPVAQVQELITEET